MAKVTGVGGVFFKGEDHEKLQNWYRDILGVPANKEGYLMFPWREFDNSENVGATVFSVFDAQSEYFGKPDQGFMINFRVDNLDEMLEHLKSQGITVLEERQEFEFGKFGWAIDPAGNRIELWEPTHGDVEF